jgi:FkbM family methyltransferase
MSILPLRLKSALVGSPFERRAHQLRWLLRTPHRYKHPELWEMFLEGERFHLVLKKLLKPDSNAADVGCHLGSFLHLLMNIAPLGQHVAIEPSRTKAAWLAKKFPRTPILNVAIGDQAGRATFEENVSDPGLSKLLSGEKASSNVYYEVEVCRLDDILKSRIDLLKLDIEGNELAALKGGKDLIRKWRPSILFEFGMEYDKSLSRRELFDLLTDEGYSVYTFVDLVFDKGPMEFSEFRKCGLYPFRAFNYVALPNN